MLTNGNTQIEAQPLALRWFVGARTALDEPAIVRHHLPIREPSQGL
jgi:hypothetical protein